MNVYQYIAYSNPDAANELCNKHGYYQIQSYEELADCLQSIVARKGESAFKEVMELHPEKEVVLELFEKKVEAKPEPLTPPIQIMEQKREEIALACLMQTVLKIKIKVWHLKPT